MRRDKNDNAKKERIVMIVSSVFVLTALTMTGIYMQAGDEEAQDNGYTLDFTALEDKEEGASITDGVSVAQDVRQNIQQGMVGSPSDDLDYMPPLEAGSERIEIPGVTTVRGDVMPPLEEPELPVIGEKPETPKEQEATGEENGEPQEDSAPQQDTGEQESRRQEARKQAEPEETATEQPAAEQTIAEQPAAEQAIAEQTPAIELHFSESDGLLRPLEGEVLIPFSMDGSVYFSTLDLYKYNPAVMLVAQEGSSVLAGAEGRVVDVYQDAEIGQAITMDLGDGYQITYGQLQGVMVAEGSYVKEGDMIASVAAPTKYFSVEGANLYLKVTQNGTPVDPEDLFR